MVDNIIRRDILRHRMITQADRVISKFGTQQALADAISVRQSTVAAWKKRGFIPMRQAEVILRAAREKSIDLTADDFFGGVAAE